MAKRKPGRPPQPHAEYRRIAAQLKARIRRGEWNAGAVLPSTRRLAAHYKTGLGTVRWALANLKSENLISPNARKRLVVLDARGGSGPTKFLILQVFNGYLDNWLPRPSFQALQAGILRQVGALKASLLVSGDPHYRFAVPPDVYDLPLRGIVLAGQFYPRTLALYEKMSVPVVLADRAPQRSKLRAACVDNVKAAFDATNRLIALGHRRIAFFRLVVMGVRDVDPDSRERQEGYTRALKAAGLAPDPRLVVNFVTGNRPDSAALKALFKARPRVTAVLAADPGLAVLAEKAARLEGRAVPGELSIVCFQESNGRHPHLAGPRVDFEALGAAAVELLFDLKRRTLRVPAEWADGSTVGPAR